MVKTHAHLPFLRTVPLLQDLEDDVLNTLAQDFRLKQYGKDEIIFRQGDSSRELYIVKQGKVRVFKISPAGGETSTNIFFTGDIFGEFAAIDGDTRSATAKMLSRTTLLEMSHERFLDHMRHLPGLALNLSQLLCRKVRWTATYAETVAQFDAAGRLLHTLLLYNEQYGKIIEPGKRYSLDLSLNQADLASLIGARREWVNRLLQSWRRRELIEYHTGKIIILDLPRVKAELDSHIEA